MGGTRATGVEPSRRGKKAEATRRRLLDVADGLFYAEGIRATGVGAIAGGAGVTKMTFYSHFASKDELVCAYLEERDRRWREALEDRLGGHEDPVDRVLSVFDAYREWLVEGGLRGCAYVNCAAEFPERDHPARQAVRRHKAGFRRRLAGLVAGAGVADPEGVAERLFLLLEGSYVTGALEGDDGIVARARGLAAELVGANPGEGRADAAGGRADDRPRGG